MLRGYQENYLVAIRYTDQELRKRRRNGILDFRIINMGVIIEVMSIDSIIQDYMNRRQS